MRIATLFAAAAVLAGCAEASVISGDSAGVWLREPLIGRGDPDEVATRFCGRYDKQAVLQTSFVPGDNIRSIWIYDCREGGVMATEPGATTSR